nr:hypothetical protein [Tanacetum cinerariifolium]
SCMITCHEFILVKILNLSYFSCGFYNASHESDDLTPIDLSKLYDPKTGNTSKAAGKRKRVTGSHGEDSRQRTQKVPHQASKVVGDASTPLDVDSDPNIHGRGSLFLHFIKPGILLMPSEKGKSRRIGLVLSWRRIGQVNGLHNEYNRLMLEEKK